MLRIAFVLLASLLPLFADDAEEEAKAKEALKTFDATYQSKEEKEQIAAVRALGRVAHPLVFDKLATVASTAEADPVREAAVNALVKSAGRKEVTRALAAALGPNLERDKVQVLILRGLGESEDPAAVEVLRKWLTLSIPKRDRTQTQCAVAAVNALERLHLKASFEVILEAGKLNVKSPGTTGKGHADEAIYADAVGSACHAALARLTGEHFTNFDHWAQWWADNAAKYDDHLKPKQ